ncbi:MAG: Uma2 family endonuclease [Tychonema bourrellyi B0820]|uniref:Uma2 family endonuclease n=1 Tax=Tychonema bourrellyi FEM_GT703 TaxID=2040638 RepID=A0A2G4F0I3_9CYAN|nr:Uma2 family endonuclease [Tychonema bourrellyi]MDQ2096992.1 Uma2 family endonuclease [Tychonema bourrellyi B0820]PHX55271.1 Uma2 family endonuclease [Tychonema bourrellyi FEM_GT703]
MVTTTSTPVEQQITPENRVVLKGVSWSTFKALVADVGDDRAWRIAYDRGVLEIRMPLEEHEEPKRLIESFVEAIVDELEIELRSLGSLTLEREDLTRAVEPDSCFYIQNESVVRGRNINLPNDPPPDLAIESDYTNSSVNKDAIYAALGVPELWRYQRQSLQVYQLVEGKYQKCDRSLAFPFLPVAEIPGFIEQSRTIGQRSAVRLFRQRIREILLSQS